MAGQYDLQKGGRVSRDEYAKLLADNMKRYGGDRDRAVRSANIAGGFGNSTAQRFMGAAAPAGGGKASTPSGPKTGGGGTKPKKQTLSGPATGAPIPMDRTTGLVEPPSLPGQDQLAGVPPDLMGLPGFDQLKGVPPDLMWGGRVPQNAIGGGVPTNPALSMASILRGVPPELQGRTGLPLGFNTSRFGPADPKGDRFLGPNGGYPIAGVRG